MTQAVQQLKDQVLGLSPHDRAEMALLLLQSLGPEEADSDPTEIAAAWAGEASRRLDAMESGQVKGVPAEQVFAKWAARRAK